MAVLKLKPSPKGCEDSWDTYCCKRLLEAILVRALFDTTTTNRKYCRKVPINGNGERSRQGRYAHSHEEREKHYKADKALQWIMDDSYSPPGSFTSFEAICSVLGFSVELLRSEEGRRMAIAYYRRKYL